MLVSYYQAKKHGWHGNATKATAREVWVAFKESFLALLSPVIILGSIYAGICSPTEAAVVGVVYSFIVGCFMDNISATIILAPMLLPTVLECGLSTVQFGVVMTMLLAIGFITPPYGINLFVASQISHEPLMKIAKKAVPLMLSMLIAAIFTMAWSGLTDGIVHLFT